MSLHDVSVLLFRCVSLGIGETAQQRQKAHADKGRRDARFAVGEEVLLSTRNLKLPAWLSSKLSAKFSGPFPIVRSINDVAYELELPATVRVHPVFHVSLLKKFKKPLERGRYTRPGPVFADSQGRKYYRLETIVAKRRTGQPRRGRRATYEYLVKWEGWPAEENTWEPAAAVAPLVAA